MPKNLPSNVSVYVIGAMIFFAPNAAMTDVLSNRTSGT
jgi:hypothetical protein